MLNQKKLYDYVIVGAGISGIYTAHELYKKYPSAKICILEATEYIGGRLHSIKYDGLIMDGGGARFNTEQHRIISLIKEIGLWDKVIPISGDTTYMPINDMPNSKSSDELKNKFPTIDDFIVYIKKYIKEKHIKREALINTTILDFAVEHFSKDYPKIKQYLINIYPYYSELGVLNSVEGINLFSNEFSDKTKYYILNGGLEQLAEHIYNKLLELKKSNKCDIDIYKETPVLKISEGLCLKNRQTGHVITIDKDDKDNNKIEFLANKLILTIPKNKLLQIKITMNSIKKNGKDRIDKLFKNINSVQNEPLYRIYARYPLDKKTHKVWFDGMGKISTNLPIKYIIPVNYEKGVVMISYTDSKFANYWIKQVSEGTFEATLNKQLKQLFPKIDIPKAKWYKHCPWISGAGYWKKGYDRKIIMPQMIEALGHHKNLYICGENYSSHQAWVEGALETSDMVLDKIYNYSHLVNKNNKTIKTKTQKTTKYSKNMFGGNKKTMKKNSKDSKDSKDSKAKEYTLEEVAKHNTKSDAWIVIQGKVVNITNWIPKHPGGDIIMKGVGKDATRLFNSIGHGDYAKKMVKKYQIGILKK
jgi:protoporphyrinogen oxidase/cytochrome b involved in lipid metabolism